MRHLTVCTTAPEAGTVISISQARKLRPRELKKVGINRCRSSDWNSVVFDSTVCVLTHELHCFPFGARFFTSLSLNGTICKTGLITVTTE